MPLFGSAEEQKASEDVEAAIQRYITACPGWRNDGHLVEYMVMVVQADVETPGIVSYNFMYSGGSIPTHHALGLLETAKAVIVTESWKGNDND